MMKLATLLAILIVCCTCIASIDAVVETYTKSFQHGVDGWWGGASVDISEGQMGPGPVGSWNQDGMTYADGDVDWCVGLLHNHPNFQYDIAMLIKFGFLKESLPVGAQVVSANMSLMIHAEGEQLRMIGRYLLQPWLNVSGPIGSNLGVGWRFRNTSANQWAALGATGEGTDVVSGVQAIFPEQGYLLAHEDHWVTVQLDRDIVQSWVSNDDSLNYGMRIQADKVNIHSRVTQHQRRVEGTWRPITLRPKLEIVYTLDSSFVPPPKAAPAPSGSSSPTPSGSSSPTPSGSTSPTPSGSNGGSAPTGSNGGSPTPSAATQGPMNGGNGAVPSLGSARSGASEEFSGNHVLLALLLCAFQLAIFLA